MANGSLQSRIAKLENILQPPDKHRGYCVVFDDEPVPEGDDREVFRIIFVDVEPDERARREARMHKPELKPKEKPVVRRPQRPAEPEYYPPIPLPDISGVV